MSENSLSARYYRWTLGRLERKLARFQAKVAALHARKDRHAITPAQYSARKFKLDHAMRQVQGRIHTMKGAIRVERYD